MLTLELSLSETCILSIEMITDVFSPLNYSVRMITFDSPEEDLSHDLGQFMLATKKRTRNIYISVLITQ